MDLENYEEDPHKSVICFCNRKGICSEEDEQNGTCTTKPGGLCFVSVEKQYKEDGDVETNHYYGCLPPNEMAIFQCKSGHITKKDYKNIKCCNEFDYCNKHLLAGVQKPVNTTQTTYTHDIMKNALLSSCIVGSVIFIFILSSICFFNKKSKKPVKTKNNNTEVNESSSIEICAEGVNETLKNDENIDNGIIVCQDPSISISLSSDASLKLVERTVSKQIRFVKRISAGKVSEIWKAKWRSQIVAVKVYGPKYKDIWKREKDTYQTPLRHENILGYIACDIKEIGAINNFYIVTNHHMHGSLRQYLKSNTVTPKDTLRMLTGLVSALAHLHTELIGTSDKPSIGHNNLDSSHILVKNDKQLCIGNFSLAARYFSRRNTFEAPKNIVNRDKRYLAPELLHNKVHTATIDTFRMSDVYSFALIVWEIINRCEIEGLISGTNYQKPFEAELADEESECTSSKMYELVVTRRIRPKIKDEWQEDPILKVLVKLIEENWSNTPSVRLTSVRIKKNVFKLFDEINQLTT